MKFIQFRRVRLASIAILTMLNLFSIYQLNIKAASIESQNTKAYKPKPGRKRTQARKPGGYRGDSCNLGSQDPVTLLVPQDHVPLTTLEHPTFFWNVNTVSHPIRFTIYEPGQPDPIYVQNIAPTTPGIVALKLPLSANALKIGVQYRWTVSVICNKLRPASNIYAKAWIERIASPINLEDQATCSSYYAQSGIWYDALSCQTRSNKEFWSLLNQIQLSTLASEQPQITFINYRT